MANETILAVLQAAVSALEAGQRAALLTIVHAVGSTPRRAGAKMLVRADGACVGTIGGGAFEERALLDAQQALSGGGPAVKHYDVSGEPDDTLGLCGGVIDVSIEILVPDPRLVIIGAGHIGQALATLAGLTGMDVVIIDDRPQWATPERFPAARQIHVVAYERSSETLAPLPQEITPSTAVVVATWGWDEPALRQILATPAFYIGLVGSRRKRALIAGKLTQHGVDEHAIVRVRAPAGLDLGGDSPGEIALSIMAEIQLARSGRTGQPLSSLRKAQVSG